VKQGGKGNRLDCQSLGAHERPVFPELCADCQQCAWSSCGAEEGEEMENAGLELVRLDALGT